MIFKYFTLVDVANLQDAFTQLKNQINTDAGATVASLSSQYIDIDGGFINEINRFVLFVNTVYPQNGPSIPFYTIADLGSPISALNRLVNKISPIQSSIVQIPLTFIFNVGRNSLAYSVL